MVDLRSPNDWAQFYGKSTCCTAVCVCRYQSVAKNKRLRVFIVPRDQVDEVGWQQHRLDKRQ